MDFVPKVNQTGQTLTLNVESARFALDQHSLVSVAEIDGTIIYVNDTFCKVSGYTESELLGKKHNILNSGNKSKSYWQEMHNKVLSGKVWHDEVWDVWIGDPTRIKQIILNIASNAVKFTEKGEVSIQLTTKTTGTTPKLSIIFQDTGIGMTDEAIEQLFHRFSQADTSTTRKYGGTGLGMSIAASLVKMMKGNIQVESDVGHGSKFTVDLPLRQSKKETLGTQQSNMVHCPDLTNKTILVADDNQINRVILKKALAASKATIIEAENGQEAFDLALKHSPNIVLMDIQMPVMDGIASLKILKESSFPSPVVAFTANVLAHQVEQYLNEGFTDCLSKPVALNALYSVLVELV